MTLDTVESVLWHQARNLNAGDPITRRTSMDAVLQAVTAYGEEQVVLANADHPSIVAKRLRELEEVS